LELINTLSDEGMSNKEISEFLNSMGIKTPKGKDYYPKLIWVTLKKYRKRLERCSPYKVERSSEKLIIQSIRIVCSKF
jgi:DNA-binding transcriptional MerR regulator